MSQVLNAAMLYWPMPNTLYVEGYALDRFAEGSWALQPVHQNKVSAVLTRAVACGDYSHQHPRLCSLELISQNRLYFFSHGIVFFSRNKSALQISCSSAEQSRAIVLLCTIVTERDSQ